MTGGQEQKIKISETRKAECSSCGGVRNCWIRGKFSHHSEYDGIYFYSHHQILQCMGCDYTFFMITNANSEDYIRGDHDEIELVEHNVYWPAVASRKYPEWFDSRRIPVEDPSELEAALVEVYGALNNELRMLAAIGMRTVFDVASKMLDIDSSLNFKEKIDELVEKKHIGPSDRARIEAFIDAGSASAHRGWRPRLDELNAMMEILEHFIYHAFVEPSDRRKLNDVAQNIKSLVPPRSQKVRNNAQAKELTAADLAQPPHPASRP